MTAPSTNPYFYAAALVGANSSSNATSASVSPNASGLLSLASCSTAVSKLSLASDESSSRSPSTSACTSISDASSEIPSLGMSAKSASTKAGLVAGQEGAGVGEEEEDEELDALEVEKREQQELDSALLFGTLIVQREARALAMAAKRLSKLGPQKDGFREAVKLVLRATNGERGGKVVMTGVGKSGIIAKKLSATFLSLGTSSVFLHPVEALHGDLGLLTPHRDVVVALSHSGSSPELLALVPHFNARKCPIIALVGKRESALVKASDAWIDCGTGKNDNSDDEDDDLEEDDDDDNEGAVTTPGAPMLERSMSEGETSASSSTSSSGISTPSEADSPVSAPPLLPICSCSHQATQQGFPLQGSKTRRRRIAARPTTDEAWDEVPAPSSSTTVALAMGDALAFSITRAKGLGREMFAFNHPGGKLGADFRMQGHAVPLQSFDMVVTKGGAGGGGGGGSAVATPITH